ncbi:MAG: long-chain-fatty-acid--CoA ligase [Gammaproteobacteria bacterium]
MQGLMMDTPLLISAILRFAETSHPDREIVSVTADNPLHRYTYADAFARARQLANALERLGLQKGERIATLAWNDHRHFELYYAVSCMGAVCHTINPRLFTEQIEYIINHADDQYVFVDPSFVPLLEQLQDSLGGVKGFVVLTDVVHMPQTTLQNPLCYEELLAAEVADYEWPELDERAASVMCYTSGTTGNPKGVVYSHRATILHAYGVLLPDIMGLSATDCVLPLVPMFHVSAWGMPYAAPMVGAKLVLPGPKMADAEALYELVQSEQVTYSAGVPTVWLGLLGWLREQGETLDSLQRICVGGAACPVSVIEEFRDVHNVYVHHGWGMTETSPVGVYNALKAGMDDWPAEQKLAVQAKQGRGLFGIEMKIVDDNNRTLPWDGETFGALKVRGPWVCSAYFREEAGSALDADGWFDTGDVATIDMHGYMTITDRNKDIIKSGGEWISSITLENTAVNHPQVAEAAVIGIAHPKWSERPLLVIVPLEGAALDEAEMLRWFEGKVASWWIPDAVVFADAIPHTATGKIKKTTLREEYADFKFVVKPDS